MSLLARIFGIHLRNAANSITETVFNSDPEAASQAEIEEKAAAFERASSHLAQARQNYAREQKEADQIVALYNQRLAAAGVLQQKLDSAADGDKPGLQRSLEQLVKTIEGMKPQVEREQQEAVDAKAFLDEVEASVQAQAEELKGLRAKLTGTQRELERAQMNVEQANERAKIAADLAGINQKGSHINSAMSAMQNRIDALKQQADAANSRAAMLKPTKPEEDDPHIAAAMAAVTGETKPTSLSDRLAALKLS